MSSERKRGRPLADDPKGTAIYLRLTFNELSEIRSAAATEEMSVSAFVRRCALKQARQILLDSRLKK